MSYAADPKSVLSSIALLLTACGGPPAPTEEEVKASLALEFPSYWETVEFRILSSPAWSEASGQTGSVARFEAIMELKTPTYLVRGDSLNELLVEQVGAIGDRATLTGRAQALRENRGWAVQFFLDDNPTHRSGRTMESLARKDQVIRLAKPENE